MSEATEFELTDWNALADLWRLEGALRMLAKIDENKATIPGFALARALVDAAVNDMRVTYTHRLFRVVARQGIDASKMKAIVSEPRGAKTFIVCEPYDFADLSEQEV